MIADVEAGLIDTICVKDMSRLGRNYLKVGYYTEILFPEKDVRFIASTTVLTVQHQRIMILHHF